MLFYNPPRSLPLVHYYSKFTCLCSHLCQLFESSGMPSFDFILDIVIKGLEAFLKCKTP